MSKLVSFNRNEKRDKVIQEADQAGENYNSIMLQSQMKLNNGANLNDKDIDKILKGMIELSDSQKNLDEITGLQSSNIIIEK